MSTNRHPIEQEELMAYLDGELPMDRATRGLVAPGTMSGVPDPCCRFPGCFPRTNGLGS